MKLLTKLSIVLAFVNILNAEITKDVALIDLSSSMAADEISKPIKQVVEAYLKKNIDVYGFNDNIKKIKNTSEIIMNGGTDLNKALLHISKIKEKINSLVLITDAILEDEEKLIKTSKKIRKNGTVICSVYIGNTSTSIPQILTNISDKLFKTTDINNAYLECEKVKKEHLSAKAKQIEIDIHEYELFK